MQISKYLQSVYRNWAVILAIGILSNLILIQSGRAAEQFKATLEGEFPVHYTNAGRFNTPIATFKDRIYIVYINPKGETVVGMKKQGQWTFSVVEPKTSIDPWHTQASIAVDKAGFIHVVYNMHSTPWQYKISKRPEDITSWEFRGQYAGENPGKPLKTSGCTGTCYNNWFSQGSAAIPGNQITYPFMTTDRNGVIYIAYRECFDCTNSTYHRRQWSGGIARYDVQRKTWQRVGKGVRPWAHDPEYMPMGLRIFFDSTNRMHVSWVWGKHYTDSEGEKAFQQQPNYPSYVYSDDGGETFYRIDGKPITLPIRLAQSDRIVPPSWIKSPTKGYFAGYTQVTAGPDQLPSVIVDPLSTSENVKRAFTTYRPGKGWSYPPTMLPYSPVSLVVDTVGTKTALSSGIRFHRNKPGDNEWTIFPLDIEKGAFYIMLDVAYFMQTNQFRIYAMKESGTNSLIKIWTVHFGDTVAPQQQDLNAEPSAPQNLRVRLSAP